MILEGRGRVLTIASVLLVLFAAQAIVSMRQKSVTVDEIAYIAAGYYHLKTGRFDYNTSNPPLMKIIVALPLLALEPELPEITDDPGQWNMIRQWQYARAFLYENTVDADVLLLAARLPVVALGVVLGIFVFAWSRELYGDRAALLALLLYSFSPNILAHARLATQDLGLAAFIFIAAYTFWKYVNRPNLLRLLLTGAAFAAAVATKSSAIFVIPVAGIYAAILVLGRSELGIWATLPLVSGIRPERRRARQIASFAAAFAVLAVVFVVALNAAYLFEGTLQPVSAHISAERVLERLESAPGFVRTVAAWLLQAPFPAPEPLVQLFKFQFGKASGGGHLLYLAGEISGEGWWYHMPVAFLIKTPIPLLVLMTATLWVAIRRRGLSSIEWLFVMVFFLYLGLFMYLKGIVIGLRYILPVFPFLHVLVSGLVRNRVALSTGMRVGLAALLGWYVVGTARIHPHYLAYFNESIGGPSNGYRYLADSFLDWGQDLKGLKKYMDDNNIERVRLAYFGSADARYYGIDYDYLPSVGLAPRKPGEKWWYEVQGQELPPLTLTSEPIAISATLWAGVFIPGYYRQLRELTPVDQIGHSILIYRPPGNGP